MLRYLSTNGHCAFLRLPLSQLPSPASKHNHATYRFPRVHQVESLIDVGKFQFMRNEIVDVDLAVHVPIDDFRHVAPALGAAERGAFPHAAGDELERARLDFLAGTGDADDHR